MRNKIKILAALFMTSAFAAISVPAYAAQGSGSQYYVESSGVYVNAWGGGPAIDAYVNQAVNNDFSTESNGSYTNLVLSTNGHSSYDGYCIGDYGGSQTSARAGLVGGCGGSGVGWGGNFQVIYSGCDPGFVSFKNVHWGGWLGPSSDTNGSAFYLNNAVQVCFGFRGAF